MAPQNSAVRPEADLDLADQLGHELVRFMRLITKAKSQVAKHGPDGIERAAYAILFCLVHEGPQRTSKLAEFLHSEISTISRQSSSLVQHGLVERQADPEDGRACLLAPTAEGLRVFDENRKHRARWLAEVLGDWSQEERETLKKLLARLNTGIEKNNPSLSDTVAAAQAKGASNA
ncbi:MarR family winged helix-turn-helix transcriptional regulator [Amycolatopsis sp. VS8301801F10]|uniref:MarR family winged helix-turn-helix transcriptional regulator n=1 Tax=unclassified Amycolatopsis TaxID=2618356 RepID=UPI0038FC216D